METPTINCSSLSHSNYTGTADLSAVTTTTSGYSYPDYGVSITSGDWNTLTNLAKNPPIDWDKIYYTKERKNMLRIVKVFIVDNDENLELSHRVLHKSEEQITDVTNQDLFFEIDIKPLLARHNDIRKVTLDKEASLKMGKDVFLEPIRISDLIMTVVEVAKF